MKKKGRGKPCDSSGGRMVMIPVKMSPKTLEVTEKLAKSVNLTRDCFIERLYVDGLYSCVSKVLETASELKEFGGTEK